MVRVRPFSDEQSRLRRPSATRSSAPRTGCRAWPCSMR